MDIRDNIELNGVDTDKVRSKRAYQLSRLVKEARFFTGLTQKEFAKLIDTKQPNIARAEKGEVEPSMELLEKIAYKLGTKLIYPKFGFMVEREEAKKARYTSRFETLSGRVQSLRANIETHTNFPLKFSAIHSGKPHFINSEN